MNILRFWRDYDPTYLTKLASRSKTAKIEVSKFLRTDACSYWVFERRLLSFLERYPQKNRLVKMLKEFRKQNSIKWKKALSYLKKHYYDNDLIRRMEIVSYSSIKLNSKEFIGLYIKKELIKKIVPGIAKYLKKNTLIFDGKQRYYVEDLV